MRGTLEPVKLEEGKFYHIKTSETNYFKSKKIHIDKVYPSPCYSPSEGEIDNAEDMIVFRIWSNRKKRWFFYVQSYWKICMWNDWKYEK